jgi:single-stranded DNA-binding protein
MIGENFVSLTGKIEYPNLKSVGANNTSLLNGRLAIPTDKGSNQYIKIAAWGTTAESLAELGKNTFVKVHGHIEERSYDGKCRHCGGFDKKYWTNVVVDNFVVVEE